MLKRKKNRRTLDEIGRTCFEFDVKLENNIYRYLCRVHIKGKNLKKLDEKVRFESYKQWKQYVCNKYKDYSKNKLIEFSRYLNQKMRNIKPYHEYWNIIAAVVLTLGTTKIFDVVIGTLNKVGETTFWKLMILAPFIELFIIVLFVSIIFYTLSPLWDSNVEENFFKDYKEIIDELIREALTGKINDREVSMKGIDASYHYEGYDTFRAEDL